MKYCEGKMRVNIWYKNEDVSELKTRWSWQAFVLLLDLRLLPLIHASLPLATDNGDEVVLASVDVAVMKRQHPSRELRCQ